MLIFLYWMLGKVAFYGMSISEGIDGDEDDQHTNQPSKRRIRDEEVFSIQSWARTFEDTHRPDQPPLLDFIYHGWLYKVDSHTFSLYMRFLKEALTGTAGSDEDEDLLKARSLFDPEERLSDAPIASSLRGREFVRITDLYGEEDTLCYAMIPVEGTRRRRFVNWIGREWDDIKAENGVCHRLRLLNIIALEIDIEPIKLRDGVTWMDLPRQYQQAFLELERLMTYQARLKIYRINEQQRKTQLQAMWNAENAEKFVKSKCALMASIFFMIDIRIPMHQRGGSREARDAYLELESLPYWMVFQTMRGWELMNTVYGNDWNDGKGRSPTVAMKRLLDQVIGRERRREFFQFNWGANLIKLMSKFSWIKKKRFLIFGLSSPKKIPFIITGSQGTAYYLFGVAERCYTRRRRLHTFWTCFFNERPWIDDPTKISGWKTDKTFEKVVFSLDPAPQSYAFVYKLLDAPTW